MLKTILVVGLLIVASLMLFVRFFPLDIRALHADPEAENRTSGPGKVLLRPGGDIEPPTYDMSVEALAARIEAIILATPRTTRVAGSLEDGFASYVTRSAFWGFPDVANVKVVAGEGGASLRIISRLRYGKYDMGVNRARVEGWLDQL